MDMIKPIHFISLLKMYSKTIQMKSRPMEFLNFNSLFTNDSFSKKCSYIVKKFPSLFKELSVKPSLTYPHYIEKKNHIPLTNYLRKESLLSLNGICSDKNNFYLHNFDLCPWLLSTSQIANNYFSNQVRSQNTRKNKCWNRILSPILINQVNQHIGINNYWNKILSSRSFSTNSSNPNDLHRRISSLKAKKRIPRKKRSVDEHNEEYAEGFQIGCHHKFQTFDPEFSIPDFAIHKTSTREFQIAAYATANEYDLEMISTALNKQGLYCQTPIAQPNTLEIVSLKESSAKTQKISEPEDVLHFSATYHVTTENREMYIFRDGVVVFWNIPALERKNVLTFIQDYEEGSYQENVVYEEAETLIYAYTDSITRLKPSQDLILLNEKGPLQLEKFAFSNAISMSVKLGIWEASLDSYIENIEFVTEELSNSGHVPLTEAQVLQRMGQLFALRHLINLSSDLLDTPDFYWEHEALGQLFNKTANHLSIQKRTSVMNSKLGHCVELMDLLKSHLSQKHSARLEWIIIILIMVEVFFEVLHFIK